MILLQARIKRKQRGKENLTIDDNDYVGDDLKMLLVVRMDLKMGKGLCFYHL